MSNNEKYLKHFQEYNQTLKHNTFSWKPFKMKQMDALSAYRVEEDMMTVVIVGLGK